MNEPIKYKGYLLYTIETKEYGKNVLWSHSNVWMIGCFDSIETAKYCIDMTKEIQKVDNFFSAISHIRDLSLLTKEKQITKEIINNYLQK